MARPNVRPRFIAQQGFTLLEVLIAIGITAMIGLGSWQILNSALNTNEATQSRLKELNALQRSMLILGRDLKQVLPRATRDEFGDYNFALSTKNEFYALEFTRAGWRNPLNDKRSDVQRVGYELDGDKLIRHHWLVLDRAQDSETSKRTLLKQVNGFDVQVLNDKGAWTREWPGDDFSDDSQGEASDPREKNNRLPKAVKIEINTDRFGKVTRIFEMPVYLSGIEIKKPEDDKNQNNNVEGGGS